MDQRSFPFCWLKATDKNITDKKFNWQKYRSQSILNKTSIKTKYKKSGERRSIVLDCVNARTHEHRNSYVCMPTSEPASEPVTILECAHSCAWVLEHTQPVTHSLMRTHHTIVSHSVDTYLANSYCVVKYLANSYCVIKYPANSE